MTQTQTHTHTHIDKHKQTSRELLRSYPVQYKHSTAGHIYLQEDLNSKDCGESIVKITKYLKKARHRLESSSHDEDDGLPNTHF